jgi:hypothetical protein
MEPVSRILYKRVEPAPVPRWAKVLAIAVFVSGFVLVSIFVISSALRYYWVHNGFIGGAIGFAYGLIVEHRFYWSTVAAMAGGLAPAVLIYSTVKLLELWGKRKQ